MSGMMLMISIFISWKYPCLNLALNLDIKKDLDDTAHIRILRFNDEKSFLSRSYIER